MESPDFRARAALNRSSNANVNFWVDRPAGLGRGCVKTYRNFEEQKTDLSKRTIFDDRQHGKSQVTPEKFKI
jgi:hypothetical protein